MTTKMARVLGVALVLFLGCVAAFAQSETGRISGGVTDQSGGAIAGATVTIVDVARGESRPLTTDSAGQYTATNLIPGLYTVRGEAKGFQTLERPNITVGVSADIRIDLTMQPGAQTQTVTVTSEVPQVNTTNSQTGGTLEDNLLQSLPVNGGSYRYIIDKLPGTLKNPSGSVADQSTNGGLSSWDNYMLDGLYDVSVWMNFPTVGSNTTSGDTTLLPLDAIEEINLVTNPKAEYGYFPGVTVDVGLKSGTNNIHGSAWAFGRGTAFDAKNPFSTATAPAQFMQFGAVMGGPIKKNKIFYFGAYEGSLADVGYVFGLSAPSTQAGLGAANSFPDAIAAINTAIAAATPGAVLNTLSLNIAGCDVTNANIHSTTAATVAQACTHNQYGAPSLWGNTGPNTTFTETPGDTGKSNAGLFKVDYKINDHHAFNAEYYMGDSLQTLPNTAQIGSIPTQTWWEEIFGVYTRTGRVVEIWTPNSTWLNEARAGYDFQDQPEWNSECGVGSTSVGKNGGPASYLASYGFVSGTAFNGIQGCGLPEVTLSGFSGTLDGIGTRQGGGRDLQFSDNVSYTRGKHQFKWGYDLRKQCLCLEAKDVANGTGVIAFGKSGFAAYGANNNVTPHLPAANALEDFLAGAPNSEAILYAPTATRNVHFNLMAAFVQDDWRVTSRLTLNLGFREELQTPGRASNGQLGNFDPTTVSGMVQSNQMWRLQSAPSPHIGFAYDLRGKGTTVIRSGFSMAYAGPAMTDWTTSSSDSFQQEPTGAALYYANGTHIQGPGNITSIVSTYTPTATANVIIPATALPWSASVPNGASNPIFNGAALAVAACGNGLVPTGAPAGTAPNPPTCSLYGDATNFKMPYVFTWNLGVQHAFTPNITLDVAYIGTHGGDAQAADNINAVATPGNSGSSEQLRRVFYSAANNPYGDAYPWFGSATYEINAGNMNYNGLQITFKGRSYHGLGFSAGYTWSHSMASGFNYYNLPSPIYGGTGTYGDTATDFRQRFTLTQTYNFPSIKSPLQMLEGWSLNSVVLIMSAAPLSLTENSYDLSGTGSDGTWNLTGNVNDFNKIIGAVTPIPCYGVANSTFAGNSRCSTVTLAQMPASCIAGATNALGSPAGVSGASAGPNGMNALIALGCYVAGPNNESAITPPAQGTFGTMPTEDFRAGASGGYKNWDLSLQKNWKIKELLTAQFRIEAFNLLNRVDYSTPGAYGAQAGNNLASIGVVGTSQATDDISKGNPLTGPGGPRLYQLGLKFIW